MKMTFHSIKVCIAFLIFFITFAHSENLKISKVNKKFYPEEVAIFEVDNWAPTNAYDESSIEKIDIAKMKESYWIKFADYDFGKGACYFELEVNNSASFDLDIHINSLQGPPVASFNFTEKSKDWFLASKNLAQEVSGKNDVFFKVTYKTGNIISLSDFIFRSVAPGQKKQLSKLNTKNFDEQSHPLKVTNNQLEEIKDGSWISFKDFDFGKKSNFINIEAASAFSGGNIEVFIDSLRSKPIGIINVRHTGSKTLFFKYGTKFKKEIKGKHDLYLKFVDSFDNPDMFITKNLVVSHEEPESREQNHRKGQLNIYAPVPGLSPSPYYTFSIQKLANLNHSDPVQATNWQKPFAWFSKCHKDKGGAYFHKKMGDWSQTYCNFEIGPDTPVVIKIKRLNKTGAPSGPISIASVRPARHVKSCKVIDGDVYIVIDKPALINVDIDGQMDGRDAPRNKLKKSEGDKTPFDNEMDGVHSVSIFANPFIDDKPDLNDPNVFAVEPGTVPPKKGPWKTLYFKPGIHNLSIDQNGKERPWVPEDTLVVESKKQYYIPGDAIVYGNIRGIKVKEKDESSESIRIYGHGTLCGTKMNHWRDFREELLKRDDMSKTLRVLQLFRAKNCIFEGLTVNDPPEHGFYIFGESGSYKPNYIRWIKTITWRVNNDAGGIGTNSYMEDCFIRHQDDGIYVGKGAGLRRVVFWSDVNGCPLRMSFALRFPRKSLTDKSKQLIMEDLDFIYARSSFSASGGIIGKVGFELAKEYPDGTPNTGQHLVFRNIRVSDPRPQRVLFNTARIEGTKGPTLKGATFQNIYFEAENTWGSKPKLHGTSDQPYQYLYFDNVNISGKKVTPAFLKSDHIEGDHVIDSIFKPLNISH